MKSIRLLYIAVFCVCNMACKKDFLDVPDKTTLLRQAYVTDLKTAGDFLNGVYVELGSRFYDGYQVIYTDLIADDVKPVGVGSSVLSSLYSWNQQANATTGIPLQAFHTNANGVWLSGYRIIRSCNFLIETVDEYRKEDPEKADNIKGQAYALRALVHFILVNTFAQSYNYTPDGSHMGIPYITSSDWNAPVSRQTVSQDYEGMIADLNNAIELLPSVSTDTRLMNQPAAKALLARTFLFKSDFQSAKNTSVELARQFPIMQVNAGYPDNLFKFLPPSQTESFFQIPPSSTAAPISGSYSTFFAGHYYGTSVYQFTATTDILSILKENTTDVRQKWVTSGTKDTITKFPKNAVTGWASPGTRAYHHTVIRSSELYLNAAESYARMNIIDSALFYLNAIRKRANAAALPVTATGSALIDSIYKERRKELAFEGMRMFDLQRWKKPVHRDDVANPLIQDLPYPSNKAIAPIPSQDVELSGLSQNIDY